MKIVRRCSYMIYPDVLVEVGLTEKRAKIICKELNENNKNRMVFYQVVTANFILKR